MSDQPRGELVIQTIAMPKDTNPNGDIFGGWLTSQMDLGSGILAAKTAQARVVTVAMEGMSFLQPVRVGDTVRCYARVEKIGRTSMTIPVEVWVTRYMTGEELRVTHGVFTLVAVDESGKPIPVREANHEWHELHECPSDTADYSDARMRRTTKHPLSLGYSESFRERAARQRIDPDETASTL